MQPDLLSIYTTQAARNRTVEGMLGTLDSSTAGGAGGIGHGVAAGRCVGKPVAVQFRGKNMDKAKHTGRWMVFNKVRERTGWEETYYDLRRGRGGEKEPGRLSVLCVDNMRKNVGLGIPAYTIGRPEGLHLRSIVSETTGPTSPHEAINHAVETFDPSATPLYQSYFFL